MKITHNPFVSTESEDGNKSNDDPFVCSESEDNGETDCSIDISSFGDDNTIVLSSESVNDSQAIPKFSVPLDYITNPEHFSPFTGGFIDLSEVRDTSDKYFTISMLSIPLYHPTIVKTEYTVFIIHNCNALIK